MNLEGIRQRGRVGLEGVRQAGRSTLRGMPTYGDTHARPQLPRVATPSTVIGSIMAKHASGQPLSAPEQSTFAQFMAGRGHGRRGGGGGDTEQSAYGPDGHKIVLRGGKWVDPVTGKPAG